MRVFSPFQYQSLVQMYPANKHSIKLEASEDWTKTHQRNSHPSTLSHPSASSRTGVAVSRPRAVVGPERCGTVYVTRLPAEQSTLSGGCHRTRPTRRAGAAPLRGQGAETACSRPEFPTCLLNSHCESLISLEASGRWLQPQRGHRILFPFRKY